MYCWKTKPTVKKQHLRFIFGLGQLCESCPWSFSCCSHPGNHTRQASVFCGFLKGTLSRGFLRFGVKHVPKIKLNAFSRTRNTPRTSREGNQMIFSKEEQTIVNVWRFFQETKEKLENISLRFSSCNPLPSKGSAAKHT